MTREIAHMRSFSLALESMGKPPLSIGKIAPTSKLADQFFNDSTGEGDHGEVDMRGPWNEGEPWEFVEASAFDGSKKNGELATIRSKSAPEE
ncbi:Mn-containing catalase [Mycoplana sp. BE70]|nr:Mn-containing catalase [Mycoplana sp. BE70]